MHASTGFRLDVVGLGPARPCSPNRLYFHLAYALNVSNLTTRSDIGPARAGPSAEVTVSRAWLLTRTIPKPCSRIRSETRARWGEEPDVDPEQSKTPATNMASSPVLTCVGGEGADKSTSKLTERWIRARPPVARRARRTKRTKQDWRSTARVPNGIAAIHRRCGLAVATDSECKNIPKVSGNWTARNSEGKVSEPLLFPLALLWGQCER